MAKGDVCMDKDQLELQRLQAEISKRFAVLAIREANAKEHGAKRTAVRAG